MKITLTGEQNRVFSLPVSNLVQIKGVLDEVMDNRETFIEVMSKQPEWIVSTGFIREHPDLNHKHSDRSQHDRGKQRH